MSIMSWKVFTQSLKYKILPYTVQFINSVIQLHSCIICDVRLVYKLIAFWGSGSALSIIIKRAGILWLGDPENMYTANTRKRKIGPASKEAKFKAVNGFRSIPGPLNQRC